MIATDTRALGLDLGRRRIGVAVSDSDRRVATPIDTIDGRDRPAAWRRVRDLAAEWEAGVVVIGLPLSLDGTDGPAATQARADAASIAEQVGLPVELHDERLTTVTAHRELRATEMNGRDRRKVVDMVAASVMLQSWLDTAADTDSNTCAGEAADTDSNTCAGEAADTDSNTCAGEAADTDLGGAR